MYMYVHCTCSIHVQVTLYDNGTNNSTGIEQLTVRDDTTHDPFARHSGGEGRRRKTNKIFCLLKQPPFMHHTSSSYLVPAFHRPFSALHHESLEFIRFLFARLPRPQSLHDLPAARALGLALAWPDGGGGGRCGQQVRRRQRGRLWQRVVVVAGRLLGVVRVLGRLALSRVIVALLLKHVTPPTAD